MEMSIKLEKWLLDNIGGIGLIFGLIVIEIYILGFNKFETITLQSTITTIGAIFAFWYGYKKYERNKELEIFNHIVEGRFGIKKGNLLPWYIIYKMEKLNYIKKDFYEIIDKNNTRIFRLKLKEILNKDNLGGDEIEHFVNILTEGQSISKDFKDKIIKIIKNIKEEDGNNEKVIELLDSLIELFE